MTSPLNDPQLEALLDRLHAQSDVQINETDTYFERRDKENSIDQENYYDLDRNKAEFCYLLCRSLRAGRVVEAGTSFGVSTLYLAAAVRDNQIENGVVIGTEFEPNKIDIARANFEQAGLSGFIELREGDLRETLQDIHGPVDFMLVDIWEVAQPALELVSPHLRPGANVACDNTMVHANEYRDYFEFVNDPRNRFRTMTVPFTGGFELTVRL